MATRRRPPASAASSTPVRIGRASSRLAARTTWVRAAEKVAASRVTASAAGSGRRRNSSAGRRRTVNCDRPAEMTASLPSAATSTADGSTARTMSAASRAGTTHTPSASPLTVASTWTVRSRSLPASLSVSPETSMRTPDRAGRAPPRVAAARAAVPRASRRVSRSARNFIGSASWSSSSVGGSPCGLPRLQLALSCLKKRERAVGTVDWGKSDVLQAGAGMASHPASPASHSGATVSGIPRVSLGTTGQLSTGSGRARPPVSTGGDDSSGHVPAVRMRCMSSVTCS